MMMFHRSSGKIGFHRYETRDNVDIREEKITVPNDEAAIRGPPPPPPPPGVAIPSYYPAFTRDRNLVLKMLKMEQKLRTSEETQREYDNQRKVWDSMDLTQLPPTQLEDKIQLKVLEEHGINPSQDNLGYYRSLNGLYENDPELRKEILYMRHDKSREGDLKVGGPWPDVVLTTRENEPIKLSDLYTNRDRPCILIGASRS